MKVLIVASYNKKRFAPFVEEQADFLRQAGCQVESFGVIGKGLFGYVKNFPNLLRKIHSYRPDIIHAHYGLCGLLSNIQRRIPVVTTYHGSDINQSAILRFSKISISLSAWNIFVSQANAQKARAKKRFSIIPCGVSIENFPFIDKKSARQQMALSENMKYVLFAGAFDNGVKNASLAHKAVDLLKEVALLELKGYNRMQVAVLMQAVDCFLMTSLTEGSPQVIKEAMICGCPIVSVDVGDVKEQIDHLDGCYIAARNPEGVADKLKLALRYEGRTKGRDRIKAIGLDNRTVADKILKIYRMVSTVNN